MYYLFDYPQIFIYIHILWICPIFLTAFSYLVYLEVGWSGLLVTGFVVLQTLMQLFPTRIFTKLRLVLVFVRHTHAHTHTHIHTHKHPHPHTHTPPLPFSLPPPLSPSPSLSVSFSVSPCLYIYIRGRDKCNNRKRLCLHVLSKHVQMIPLQPTHSN